MAQYMPTGKPRGRPRKVTAQPTQGEQSGPVAAVVDTPQPVVPAQAAETPPQTEQVYDDTSASVGHLIPRELVKNPEDTGTVVLTNPRKFVGVLVDWSPEQMRQHEALGVYFPQLGDVDEDGDALILNETTFRVAPDGRLLYGSCVAGVRRREVHEELRRREAAAAKKMRDDLVGSAEAPLRGLGVEVTGEVSVRTGSPITT